MKKILMVCLGNICRSPLAEGILKSKIQKKGLQAIVDSAGTSSYHTGDNPDRRAVQIAKSFGIDISRLEARQFIVQDFDNFDHIYVMDTSNYNDVVSMARTEEDKAKVNLILNFVEPDSNMSVPDPYFGGDQGFKHVFMLLDQACEVIVKSLEE